MNVNYEGSVAQRFMTSRTGLQSVTDIKLEPFNSVVLYVPKDLATKNITGVTEENPDGYAPEKVTETLPFVQAVTADNYKVVMKDSLLAQWAPAFRDGANLDLVVYLVVFFIPEEGGQFTTKVTTTANSIDYKPLTDAFKLTYTAGFFKMLFLEDYNIAAEKGTIYDHRLLQLALSYQCSLDDTLSGCFVQVTAGYTGTEADNNIYRDKPEVELRVANPAEEASYKTAFWGNLKVMNCNNSWVIVHTETVGSAVNVFPVVLAQWFSAKNASGQFLGNKLSKTRLTGVKPTGRPSVLNSAINTNLPKAAYDILDSKNIAYLMSIADNTQNDSIVDEELCVDGKPLTAIGIAKYIDYQTSMDLANWVSNQGTTTTPILKNEDAYNRIKQILLRNLRKFTGNGKIADIKLNFPSYAALPESKTDIIVTAAWTAKYISDLKRVEISGTITY